MNGLKSFDNAATAAIPTSPNGFIYYRPDGRWHWSAEYCTHESAEDQRVATGMEAALATSYLEQIAELKAVA